ncbi:hypothetical protein [Aureimonas sp. SA4125]|uniref:hypothetical protein n=1 Tax=Aureimonas sp. SA4125 TaxID=2826993 RepID=UPI001CC4F1FC|nr:hypothetical protein [Aureimonas sp. SA4125]
MNAIARKALPRAAAAVMNRAAREAKVALAEHAVEVFDRPKPMTLQAFVVRKARVGDAGAATMSVSIKEPTASYLYRQIVGGVRRTGEDGGSGRHDLFTYAIRPDRYGGVPRGASRKLAATNKAEKAARKAARATGKRYGKTGGIFFGEIHGTKGYWRRPRGRDGSPTLLLKVQETSRYRKQFRFEETVKRSYRKFVTQREFGYELDRQIARALATSGGRR